jgi:hypothetical protein
LLAAVRSVRNGSGGVGGSVGVGEGAHQSHCTVIADGIAC